MRSVSGLITTYYGSGIDSGDISITHKELRKAIELNKPRWLLAHGNVAFARGLIKHLRYEETDVERGKLTLDKNKLLDDLRVIDMYEEAMRDGIGIPALWARQLGSKISI